MSKPTVIITYGRSLIALSIAQSLHNKGIDVIGCDCVDLTVLSFSKSVKTNHVTADPDNNPKQFLNDLNDIIETYRPKNDAPYVLIPSFREAKLISKNRYMFDGKIVIACPDFEVIEKIHPKDNFADTSSKHDWSVPTTHIFDDDDLSDYEQAISFPTIIKPADDVGGRGITLHEKSDTLKKAFRDLRQKYPEQQIIIQDAIEGEDYCYCGLFDEGELICETTYRNIRTYPKESGPGVVRETFSSDPFSPHACQMMKDLKWSGVVEIDFRWNGSEEVDPKIIEVNPRFWAGLDHCIQSGVDFPYYLYALFTNQDVKKIVAGDTFDENQKTGVAVLATLARFDELWREFFNVDELDKNREELTKHFHQKEYTKAATIFKDAVKDSLSISRVKKAFDIIKQESQDSEIFDFTSDDPFVGLGFLFVLSSLIRFGELPPEIKR